VWRPADDFSPSSVRAKNLLTVFDEFNTIYDVKINLTHLSTNQ
jgi:hypothetical protein